MKASDTAYDQALKRELDYFMSQGLDILQAPTTVPFLVPPRQPSHPGPVSKDMFVSRDTLLARTLNSDEAIAHMLGFYQDPFYRTTDDTSKLNFPDLPFITRSVSLLLQLNAGLHGFHGTVHGGLICVIMDEAMGTVLFQNELFNREAKERGVIPKDAKQFTTAATASLDVRYRRPIATPQVVIVTAFLDRIEGREFHIRVVVKSKDGKEYARSNGSFMSFSNVKL